MDNLVTLKKYRNRRLYDPTKCRYINLADIHKLVLNRRDFVVIEAHTEADITVSVLLQVIASQERAGKLRFHKRALCGLIQTGQIGEDLQNAADRNRTRASLS